MNKDRAEAIAFIAANDRVEARLDKFVGLIARWRQVNNIVSDRGFYQVWMRHIADSAQILKNAPLARRWVDFGSGAGFPGMVIAILLAETQGGVVHCIESDQRKSAFLREVVRTTNVPAVIHATRMDIVDRSLLSPVDAITSRAVASLPDLIQLSDNWLRQGAVGVFPQGRSALSSIEALSTTSGFRIESLPNELDPEGRIIRIRRRVQALKSPKAPS